MFRTDKRLRLFICCHRERKWTLSYFVQQDLHEETDSPLNLLCPKSVKKSLVVHNPCCYVAYLRLEGVWPSCVVYSLFVEFRGCFL